MKPMEEGMEPVIPLEFRLIAVTAVPVHVTPVHIGVEHTPLRGVLPEQRHPVRPDMVQRLVA